MRVKKPGKLRSLQKTLYDGQLSLCCLELLEWWVYLLSQNNLVCSDQCSASWCLRQREHSQIGSLKNESSAFPGVSEPEVPLENGPKPSSTQQEYFLTLSSVGFRENSH